ncbi:HAD family hydrolase [Leucothrix pacifica]|uniref:Histidinol-phosphatase n=1 Tax=Leucothrix pacifica TaxID=1247513 RepID=A0A317CGU3_9GAMM|nr:HAD family hydrolase [Leucothrix pacifica]PWQ97738.1 HAD-IB family hydrolase [Leucothrix pacifica]
MTLALFDLDNTLLSDDSDYQWGQFMVSKGLVDSEEYAKRNEAFYQDYQNGTLDINEYCAFSFSSLACRSMEELAVLHDEFMRDYIAPKMSSKSKALIAQHQAMGHTLMVITATNSFVTRPIVTAFGIDNLIAIEPKIENGRYTTEIDGVPSFKEGKVIRLDAWLAENGETLEDSYFYSDSHNDLPLLERVTHAIAVDPDPKLEAVARERKWDIISLIDD